MGLTKDEWHALSELDEEAETALCSRCKERVSVKWVVHRWRCRNKLRELERAKHQRKIRRSGVANIPEQLGDSCEICGRSNDLCMDHDHETNEYRGTLCASCNMALGMFKDNPELLKQAIKYLSR